MKIILMAVFLMQSAAWAKEKKTVQPPPGPSPVMENVDTYCTHLQARAEQADHFRTSSKQIESNFQELSRLMNGVFKPIFDECLAQKLPFEEYERQVLAKAKAAGVTMTSLSAHARAQYIAELFPRLCEKTEAGTQPGSSDTLDGRTMTYKPFDLKKFKPVAPFGDGKSDTSQ